MNGEKIICAGFGGQGVLSLGKLIAYAAMLEGRQVSWLPSYGPEMRGGTANCHVIVSENPIGSPVISKDATSVIVMNLPSLMKFEEELAPGGRLFINSSLIDAGSGRTDVEVIRIPANMTAGRLGNDRIANMVMLGAWVELTGTLTAGAITEALKKIFGPSREDIVALNEQAIACGRALGTESRV